MSYHDLPTDALAVMADQGWNDESLNTHIEGFLRESHDNFDDGFRAYCGETAVEETGDKSLRNASLSDILWETGWDEASMRSMMLSYGRGVIPREDFDTKLVGYLQAAADEENEAAASLVIR